MNYHIFECDRCHLTSKEDCQSPGPKNWARIEVEFLCGEYGSKKGSLQLCLSCYSLVENLVRYKRIELIDTEIYRRALKSDDPEVV
jgi:hypothetical protein